MSNTGFVAVPTLRAGSGSVSVPGLGTFSALAGPAIGPDGTVFLASHEGRVTALRPDGAAYWNRQLEELLGISAPPAVGSDGSVYVVGWMTWRDHRAGSQGPGGRAKLYRFTPGGGAPQAANTEFPHHERGPTVIGAPEVWRFGGDEAVLVPAIYPTVGGVDLHLLAFSPNGGVMADWKRYLSYGATTEGGSWTDLMASIGFPPWIDGFLPPPGQVPLPGVAIAPLNPQGGTPIIVLVNRFNQQTFHFRFCVGASCTPAPGFHELFVTNHAPRSLLSSPVTLPDGHTIVGTDDGVVFSGPGPQSLPPVAGLDSIYATPTVAADGRVVVVSKNAEVIGIQDGAVVSRLQLQGRTIARPAPSSTHVFVATTDALYTLDPTGSSEVFRFPWTNAGVWSPAIGPKGHVYAMAANILFIFPAPRIYPGQDIPADDVRDLVVR